MHEGVVEVTSHEHSPIRSYGGIAIDRGFSHSSRDLYTIRDKNGISLGPFDYQSLTLWEMRGFIGPSTIVSEIGSQTEMTYAELQMSVTELQVSPVNTCESSFWLDTKTPFTSLYARLTKSFIQRQTRAERTPLTITSPHLTISIGQIQDFEQFLESYHTPSPEVSALPINKFALPFVEWCIKCFHNIKSEITTEELVEFVTETSYDKVSDFVASHIADQALQRTFLNSYMQWRIFIPIYIEE